jgi:hypothetical protein
MPHTHTYAITKKNKRTVFSEILKNAAKLSANVTAEGISMSILLKKASTMVKAATSFGDHIPGV